MINELFKNVYDVYVDNVEVDYFCKEVLLVFWDNGFGMIRYDFEIWWLMLGMESKFLNWKILLLLIDFSKVIRLIMGEKGIGRLVIVFIGN